MSSLDDVMWGTSCNPDYELEQEQRTYEKRDLPKYSSDDAQNFLEVCKQSSLIEDYLTIKYD